MKISTILDHIDSGHMALPEFQRGYVWNRDQVRGLMDSLYKRHPVGSLLVWATQSKDTEHRGDQQLAAGVVKLLLDGQQRITSLYGIARGAPPKFFDGNVQTFTGLYFNLETEEFAFYTPVRMSDDSLWIDVSALIQKGNEGLGGFIAKLSQDPVTGPRVGDYVGRLSKILGILDIDLHNEEVTGPDKSVDVVVDIFNRVNSGGTKLSKGDLALAKICAEWPQARARMKDSTKKWTEAGFNFSLDWLLRNVNTILTGEAKFLHLHDQDPDKVEDGLKRAVRHIDYLLNLIGGRLGLDHDRVLFGNYAFPVMTHYLDRRGGHLTDARERDLALFWYLQAGMWGRFSGSTEGKIDEDLAELADLDGGLNRLIAKLKLWHGSLRVEPGHFSGWSLGNRFYPVLYMLTRVGDARDFGTGIALKSDLLGQMSKLEVHHIFPKARLYKHGYSRAEVNAVANFCLLTKDTNLQISARLPEEYFVDTEARFPGALASQWIPRDPNLWKIENYQDFLEARRLLLAAAANDFLIELLHGDDGNLIAQGAERAPEAPAEPPTQVEVFGGIDSEDEERELEAINDWVQRNGLPAGNMSYELVDENTGEAKAILDLAWPDGLQQGYSQPVALLLNEGPEVMAAASARGFRCFTDVPDFRSYVKRDVLSVPLEATS